MQDAKEFLERLHNRIADVVVPLREEIYHGRSGLSATLTADWYRRAVELEHDIQSLKSVVERGGKR